jgi:hypothetical protein
MKLTGLLLFIAGLALMAAGVVLGDGMQKPGANRLWTVAARFHEASSQTNEALP